MSRDDIPDSRSNGPNPTPPPRARTSAGRRVENLGSAEPEHGVSSVEVPRIGARPSDAMDNQLPRWALIAIVVIFITLAIGGFIFLLGYIGSLTANT